MRSVRSARNGGAVRPSRRWTGRDNRGWTRWISGDQARFGFAFLTFETFLYITPWLNVEIFALMLLSGAYLLTRSRAELGIIWRSTPILIYPALALTSVIWSEDRGITLRLALQFAYTAFLGLLIYRTVPYRSVAMALLLALSIVCGASLIVGLPDLRHGYPLHGLYGSKNIMAFIASTTFLIALAILQDGRFARRGRLAAGVVLAIAFACVITAQSAGALVSTTIASAVVIGARQFATASKRARAIFIAAAVIAAPAFIVASPVLERQAQLVQTDVLKKDDTLTGRTYLWSRAKDYISDKPVLGHGYGAFWRQGSLEAEGLWAAMGITGRAGFNFHNQYIEALMDLGVVGLLVFILTEAAAAATLSARLIFKPTQELPLYIGLITALIMRTPVESVILVQFSPLTMIFFTCCTAGLYGEGVLVTLKSASARALRPGLGGRAPKRARIAVPKSRATKVAKRRRIGRKALSRFSRSQARMRIPSGGLPSDPSADPSTSVTNMAADPTRKSPEYSANTEDFEAT